MTSLIDTGAMVAQQAQIFDDLRSGAAVAFLIKHDEHSSKFKIVLELATGWLVSWDKFREALALRVATADTSFADKLAQSTFLGYGLPDGDGMIDVYTISEDKRDKVPPTETNPAWKIFVERTGEERFLIP